MDNQIDIEQMLMQRQDDERANRKKLQEAKRLFDAESDRIRNCFRDNSKSVIKCIEQKLHDKPDLNSLLSDREFTTHMLPYMDELNMQEQFMPKLNEVLHNNFHLDWVDTTECSLTWYQNSAYELNAEGSLVEVISKAVDTIPYKSTIQKWLSAGEQYTITFDVYHENQNDEMNEPWIDDFEIGFDIDTGQWFIHNTQMNHTSEYVSFDETERFVNYEDLMVFIDEMILTQKV